jgi:hypothetical protein
VKVTVLDIIYSKLIAGSLLHTRETDCRRIIFTAKDPQNLSNCIHAAVAMLYPFAWQHILIPIVPTALLTYACAPMPYIIGVLESQVSDLDKLPLDTVVRIDLDAGTITYRSVQ